MAIRIISDAGGNWTTAACWVGGIIASVEDDVYASATSGNVTIQSGSYCRSIDLTGYNGTITSNGSDLVIGYQTLTRRSDNVAAYVPAGIKMVTMRFTFYNLTPVETTIYLISPDVMKLMSFSAVSGSFKMLNDISAFQFTFNGQYQATPLIFNFDGHTLNTISGIVLNGVYNTILLQACVINYLYYASYSYPALNVSANSVFNMEGALINYYGTPTLTITNLTTNSWGAFDFAYYGNGGTIAIASNISIRNLYLIPTSVVSLSITTNKTLTITGDFAIHQTAAVQANINCWITGGTIYKDGSTHDLFYVYVTNTSFTGSSIWNLRNNCTLSGTCPGINMLGGAFCVDIDNGDDTVPSAFGWWKTLYTGAVGALPADGEVVTGSKSGATAKLMGRIDRYDWNLGAGTLFFYGKVGTFQAETVNLSGGSSFIISQDLVNSAWRTTTTGATLARVGLRDSINVAKSPDPVSTGQLAKWTSCWVTGGGIPTAITATASSNTSPIVITKALHGFHTGEIILICNHTINTAANGIWTVTELSTSTFSLNNSIGNGVGGGTGQFFNVTSKTVALTTAVTKNIGMFNFDWTPGVNVTSALLDKYDWKFNVGSIKIITGASCGANQIIAKYALPTVLDLSEYQQISFWFKNSTSIINAGDLLVKLYSDSACTTEVNSFSIQAVGSTTRWLPITCDNHSNLSSTVRGVAIYTTIALPGKTFSFDNMIACKDSGLPDSITLQSLISKNIPNQRGDDVFIGIQCIKDNLIFIDNTTVTLPTAGRGYHGITETVTLFKRETTKIKAIATNGGMSGDFVLGRSGDLTRAFPYSGGWNKITNLIDGLTVYDGLCGWSYGLSTGTYVIVSNFHCLRWTRGWTEPYYSSGFNLIFTNNSSEGMSCTSQMYNLDYIFSMYNTTGLNFQNYSGLGAHVIAKCNNSDGIFLYYGKIPDCIVDNNYRGVVFVNSCLGAYKVTSATFSSSGIYINSGTPLARVDEIVDASYCITGITIVGVNGNVGLVRKLNYCGCGIAFSGSNAMVKEIQELSYCTGNALSFSNIFLAKVLKVSGLDNKTLVYCNGNCAEIFVYNANFTGAVGNSYLNGNGCRSLYLINWAGTFIDTNFYAGLMLFTNPKIYCHNMGAVGDHRIYGDLGNIYSEAVERHSISGTSWKLCPKSYYTSYYRDVFYPLDLPIAKILCEAGVRKTVAIWCKKSHATDVGGRLIIRGGQFEGVGTPLEDVFVEAVNVTDWQQISMSFTPTKTEVIELEFWAYWVANLADKSIWVDDISII